MLRAPCPAAELVPISRAIARMLFDESAHARSTDAATLQATHGTSAALHTTTADQSAYSGRTMRRTNLSAPRPRDQWPSLAWSARTSD